MQLTVPHGIMKCGEPGSLVGAKSRLEPGHVSQSFLFGAHVTLAP